MFLNSGVKPVSLLADPQYVRAWPGGSGFVKMGSNYAPTLFAQQKAESLGCQQCLWLFGPNEEITEVGTMNIFVLMRKESAHQTNGKSSLAVNGNALFFKDLFLYIRNETTSDLISH